MKNLQETKALLGELTCMTLLLISFGLPLFTAAAEDTPPSGMVSITATSVAVGVGVQWGEGMLTFAGHQYPFSLQGLQVLGLGYSQVTATGTVYGLQNVKEFEGVYVAAAAGAAAGSGPASVVMQNPQDVMISLHAVQEGVQLTLAAGGVEIKLRP
ncbi:MAG TPA: hypothetical protein VKK81_03705 [Candidatus Binatia bacterium]|nr:hypothetical protein [Candidatus Binatia bacterium]